MKYCLLLLAILPSFCILAQTRFSKLYDYNNNDSQGPFTVLEHPNSDGYLIGMKNVGVEFSDNKILLLRLDSFGNELWVKEIYSEGFIYYLHFGSMLRLPDGNYLLGGTIKELSTELRDVFLIKIDTSGNVLWEKTYGVDNKHDFFSNFALTPDSAHIQICGQTRRTDPAGNIWLFKTDLDGEMIWDQEIAASGWQHGEYMAMLGDASFLLACWYEPVVDLDQYKVYKISASGQIMWQKKLGTEYDDSGFPKIVALPDGSGIFTGSVGTPDWRVRLAYAAKLSPSGGVVWEKTYHTGFSSSAFAQPVVLDDGSLVLSGGVEYDTFNSPLLVRFWKIDADGEMLWERVHSYNPDTDNYIYHQTGTSDGGFIGVGFSHAPGATFQDAWVLKLDSEGCLVENCTVGTGEPNEAEDKGGSMAFAPNPGSDVVNVQYTLNATGQRGNFTLTDLYGRQVLTRPFAADTPTGQLTLDLSGLPAGTYLGTIAVDGHRQLVSRLAIAK